MTDDEYLDAVLAIVEPYLNDKVRTLAQAQAVMSPKDRRRLQRLTVGHVGRPQTASRCR